MAAQSGSARRLWPGLAPAPANSRSSRTASVTSSVSGQLSPAASNRRIVSRTVEGTAPTRRPISRIESPAALSLITSRTWRIASLPIGIRSTPSKSRKERTYQSQKRPLHPGRFHPGMVGDFISERWAVSNRNGGRFHFGIVGDFERDQQPGDLVDDDAVDLARADVVEQPLEIRPVGRPT